MKKVLLVILDGWGHSDFGKKATKGNAIEKAKVPRFRALLKKHPNTRLLCSGLDVGLPEGQMGNSEVGHLNLGGGRIVYQSIARVDTAAADKKLALRLKLDDQCVRLARQGKALHLVGLVSDGGVHSHIRHLHAILDLLPPELDVRIHCITDGRDTSPTSGAGFIKEIAARCDKSPGWSIATIQGRYFAMDRDNNWDRTQKAYRCIVLGTADALEEKPDFLERRYKKKVTDEFIPPTVIEGPGEIGIKDGDATIFFNFRADRMRQLLSAMTVRGFDDFVRAGPVVRHVTTLTEYEAGFSVQVAFPPQAVNKGLGEMISEGRKTQLRVAETEKYAHVTYFFNGGEEEPKKGEDRVLIPSPKVATYDKKPEMSAKAVCDATIKGITEGGYDFVLVNFANADMVGHTGVIPAAVKAVETVDECLGRLLDTVKDQEDWVAIVTADHGNCEKMLEKDGSPHTAHTTEPVDLAIYDPSGGKIKLREDGRLADVAPTVLEYMGLDKPKDMTGTSLVAKEEKE